jgi:uncharacterized protein (TIRG00374 family)
MKKKWSVSLLTILNVIILIFLYIHFKGSINYPAMSLEWKKIPYINIGITLILSLLLIITYSIRLFFLLNKPFLTCFSIASVGYALNNLLPFRLGEAYRLYFSHKQHAIPYTQSIYSIVIERLSDLLFIGSLASIAFFMHTIALPVNVSLISIFLILPSSVLIILLILQQLNIPILSRCGYWLQQILISLYKNYHYISIKKLLYSFFITFIIWILTVTIFYHFFKLPLFNITISLLDAISMTVVTSLSLALSTLPTSFGLFEAGIVYYLHIIKHLNETTALMLALMLHSLTLLPQLLCMSYFLIAASKKPPEKIAPTDANIIFN